MDLHERRRLEQQFKQIERMLNLHGRVLDHCTGAIQQAAADPNLSEETRSALVGTLQKIRSERL